MLVEEWLVQLLVEIKNKKYFIHLSLSDDEPWAQATVIISHR